MIQPSLERTHPIVKGYMLVTAQGIHVVGQANIHELAWALVWQQALDNKPRPKGTGP